MQSGSPVVTKAAQSASSSAARGFIWRCRLRPLRGVQGGQLDRLQSCAAAGRVARALTPAAFDCSTGFGRSRPAHCLWPAVRRTTPAGHGLGLPQAAAHSRRAISPRISVSGAVAPARIAVPRPSWRGRSTSHPFYFWGSWPPSRPWIPWPRVSLPLAACRLPSAGARDSAPLAPKLEAE
jgi:hypothetical protein